LNIKFPVVSYRGYLTSSFPPVHSALSEAKFSQKSDTTSFCVVLKPYRQNVELPSPAILVTNIIVQYRINSCFSVPRLTLSETSNKGCK